jgi:hypothetical protein
MFRQPIANEISLALIFKVLAILVLFFVFFAPSKRPNVTSEVIGTVFLGEPDTQTGTQREGTARHD